MPDSPETWVKAAVEAAAPGYLAFPLTAPEGQAPPFVTYGLDSTERPEQTSGLTGFADGQFVLQVYADSYSAVVAASNAIRAAMHNFSGTASGAIIDRTYVSGPVDRDYVTLEGRDRPTFVRELTIDIRWRE